MAGGALFGGWRTPPAIATRCCLAIVITIATVSAVGCGTGSVPQPMPSTSASTPRASASEVLATVDGASVTRIRLDADNVAYLQLIDLRRMAIDQVIGPADGASVPPSSYYPAVGSPRFERLTVQRMQSSCRDRYAAAAFSAVNFAFFETYDAHTELAFPAKADGRVITGGRGPYGPVPHPKHSYYRKTVLRALAWDDHGATITRYDPASGAPLNDPAIRNAVVTYAFADHPSHALAGDPPNRYQLLGVVDADGSNTLAILTVDRATLATSAQLLRRYGVTGEVLTFDGGVSTYLWTARDGILQAPTNAGDTAASALPHYLCVHRR